MKALLLASTACTAALLSAPAFADPTALDENGAATVDTVIVTATRNPEDPAVVADARRRLSRTPGAVAVVAAETYENRVVVGMPDLLRDVPGVLSQKRYGEESRLSIRGSGIDQSYHQRGVLLAQDGVPFADADGFSDFQKVDPMSARMIEVYKGGNALRFGGAQLGGAVNLITPTGRTAQSPNLIRVEGGAFGSGRVRGEFARAADGWDFYAAAGAYASDGYRVHSGLRQERLTLNIGRRFGQDREVRLVAFGADINQDVPGTLTLSDALHHPTRAGAGAVANRWARDQRVGRISLQGHWRLGDGLVVEGGVYTTATDLHHPISLVIDQSIATQGLFARLDWTGKLAAHDADLFFGVAHRQGHNDQDLYINLGGRSGFHFGDSRQEASGTDLFAEGRWFATPHLALVAGGSLGRATRDYQDHLHPVNDVSKDFSWFAPRVGLLWQGDSGLQVYANLTRSVEPPNYGALVQSPAPGFVPVEAQEAWTAEAGTRGRSGAFTWDLTVYRSQVKGELLSFGTGVGLPANVFNAGDTVHQGLEASLDWSLGALAGGRWRLKQSWTWSDFRFHGDPVYGDDRLPVVPAHQYRAELTYQRPSGLYLSPSVEWRPLGTWMDYANTQKAPGYLLVNLGAGLRLPGGALLFLDARNLVDQAYAGEFAAMTNAANPVVNKAVVYPGEGRSLFAGVAYRF